MPVARETLVCFAVKEEAQFFRRSIAGHPEIRVLVTGMGERNAENSVREILGKSRLGRVLTCGFAGGLRPGLRRGTVVFAGAEGTGLETPLRKAGAVPARFHGSARVVTSPAEKEQLHASTGADAVEMESFVICGLCRDLGIPSATVRVILDEAADELPLDFNSVLNEDLRISPRKLAFALLKSPAKIRGLLQLRKQSGFASKQLGRVLASALGCAV